jgi:hypothetical protein
MARWLAFSGPAIDAGVGAIFGFPLRVGAVRLGALNLHCDRPRALTDEQHADALVMTSCPRPFSRCRPMRRQGSWARRWRSANFQYVVHQASEIVAVQLDVGVGQALIRLKAHAFGNGRPLTEVAEDVVARRLRFDACGGGSGPAS